MNERKNIKLNIKLKNIYKSDFNRIKELTTNENIMNNIGIGKTWTDDKINNFINYCLYEQKIDNKYRYNYYYKIYLEDHKITVGIVGVHKNKYNEYEATIFIDEKYQGQGIFKATFYLLKEQIIKHKPEIKYIINFVHKDNEKMNLISKNKFTFINTVKYGEIDVNKYHIYIQDEI